MGAPKYFPKAHVMSFGDGPDLSNELLHLIRTGQKTAASAALEGFQGQGDPVPSAGDFAIGVDSDMQPAVLLGFDRVEVLSFDEITLDFIEAEGEGEADEWYEANEAYYRRKGFFHPKMQVICTRFHLVADLMDDRRVGK